MHLLAVRSKPPQTETAPNRNRTEPKPRYPRKRHFLTRATTQGDSMRKKVSKKRRSARSAHNNIQPKTVEAYFAMPKQSQRVWAGTTDALWEMRRAGVSAEKAARK